MVYSVETFPASISGFSATCADVNGDGRQDIYVTSYNYYGRVTPNSWFQATNGTPNLLFVSQPAGGFREEARLIEVGDKGVGWGIGIFKRAGCHPCVEGSLRFVTKSIGIVLRQVTSVTATFTNATLRSNNSIGGARAGVDVLGEEEDVEKCHLVGL